MANESFDPAILLPILQKIPLFKELNTEQHYEVIKRIILMYYPANYVLFKEGAIGDAMYIIKDGAVEIYHDPKEQGDLPEKVADIAKNGFFGEMALISEEARNASAKTTTDCQLFILNRQDFKILMETNPALAEQISSMVIARMKDNENKQ